MKSRKAREGEAPPVEQPPAAEFTPPVGAGIRTEPTQTVEITKPVIVHGEHTEPGTSVEVGGNEAAILIGAGQAKEPGSGEGEGGAGGADGAPVNKDVPYVSGAATVGGSLSCTMGNWEGEPTSYAYDWKSDGAASVGTGSTYVVKATDKGHKLTCIVTATNAKGATVAPPSNEISVP